MNYICLNPALSIVSVGKTRAYLRKLDEFYRQPWLPNLKIFRNDQNPDLENTFSVLGSVEEQLLLIDANFRHCDKFQGTKAEQKLEFVEKLDRLSEELNELKETILQVKYLHKFS